MHQKVTAKTYQLLRSRRRTISVEIDSSANVVVRAPLRTPQYEIDAFLAVRSGWIQKRLKISTQILNPLPSLDEPGAFHHRGEARVWKGAKASLDRWESFVAHEVLSKHIAEMLPGLGVGGLRYAGLKLRRMRRRWGSCAYNGTIVLNTYLIRVPDHCSKAVVAHELAHLIHMNHGLQFKQLVVELYPEYQAANKELNQWTSVLENTTSTGTDLQARKSEIRELRLLT